MIVADASIVASALADTGASGLKARAALLSELVVCPALMDLEVCSVLRKRWRAGAMRESELVNVVLELRSLPIERYHVLSLLPRIMELRHNATPYDASYLALAETLGCDIVTADARMASIPGIRCAVRVL